MAHTIRLWPDGYDLNNPCGVFPKSGIGPFWEALGVPDFYEYVDGLMEEWLKGNMSPATRDYPVISELVQMYFDNASIKPTDIPALLKEIETGCAHCADIDGLRVFDALETCALLASAQSTGLMISPF